MVTSTRGLLGWSWVIDCGQRGDCASDSVPTHAPGSEGLGTAGAAAAAAAAASARLALLEHGEERPEGRREREGQLCLLVVLRSSNRRGGAGRVSARAPQLRRRGAVGASEQRNPRAHRVRQAELLAEQLAAVAHFLQQVRGGEERPVSRGRGEPRRPAIHARRGPRPLPPPPARASRGRALSSADSHERNLCLSVMVFWSASFSPCSSWRRPSSFLRAAWTWGRAPRA